MLSNDSGYTLLVYPFLNSEYFYERCKVEEQEWIDSLISQVNSWSVDDYIELESIIARSKKFIISTFGTGSNYQPDLYNILKPTTNAMKIPEMRQVNLKVKRRLLNLYILMKDDIEFLETPASTTDTYVEIKQAYSNRVFIVHGHDEAMKLAVERVLDKLGLEPIILHEQTNSGMTIIEKFEANSDVGYAIILFSPDDMAYHNSKDVDTAKPRARQNVIFEHGFFIGKLGRERTFALNSDTDLELPSDISGVIYNPYDGADGSWRMKLVKELKSLGYDISADNLI